MSVVPCAMHLQNTICELVGVLCGVGGCCAVWVWLICFNLGRLNGGEGHTAAVSKLGRIWIVFHSEIPAGVQREFLAFLSRERACANRLQSCKSL